MFPGSVVIATVNICANASNCNTPGTLGLLGKWIGKYHSLLVKFLNPSAEGMRQVFEAGGDLELGTQEVIDTTKFSRKSF